MTLTLHVDAPRWRAAQRATLERIPGLVPVVKGNGYGFGLARLAGEADRLGVDTLAVGGAEEVATVARSYGGDVLVLAPWRPRPGTAQLGGEVAERVLHTASSLSALKQLAGTGARVVVEVRTSMNRHGILAEDLPEAAALLDGVRVEGVALHLPMAGDPLAEARRLLSRAGETLPLRTAWVSHLDAAQVRALEEAFPGVRVRLRSGTALWLGDRSSFRARAEVLDVHRLARGTRYGYRQRRMPYDGFLLVVSGGTAHGVGLEAPKAARGPVGRGKALASGVLGAAGWSLSPFTVAGRQRWFAEPPHMQVSLLLLPAGAPPPAVGEEVGVDVRMTATAFDRIGLPD